jgi:hypothetical protein
MSSGHTEAEFDSVGATDLFAGENAHTKAFSWDGEGAATLAVVETVSTVLGVDSTEIAPLNDVVDTDALNQLFAPTDGSLRRSGYVQFEYEGCIVGVWGNGTVSAVRADQS